MSKRRKGRVTSANATVSQTVPLSMSPTRSIPSAQFELLPLRELEDRRTWNPEGSLSPARSFSKPRHRLTVVDRRKPTSYQFSLKKSFPSQTRAIVAFRAPSRVLVCVRRNMRKQVLHALRKTGMTGQKRPRRSVYSSVSCRS